MTKFIKVWFSEWDFNYKPEFVGVERYNDKSVWISGRRRARHSEYENYFLTEQEAKEALKAYWSEIKQGIEKRIESEKIKIEKISQAIEKLNEKGKQND